ncbi:MAG TPA: 6-pyruvoyl-tetrahydropterin synthase-related protein [Nostocaceae cyanobacterium]|nr:6-pyruvoyl-tetrahydropterin synthase-related protein [Nostocaceae cyanobacterium]
MLNINTNRRNYLDLLLIIGVGIIVLLPALSNGVFASHDLTQFHLKWSKHFVEQFWTGDFYPRWLNNMNSGLGSPVFFFYGPIPYFFASIFHPFFSNDFLGWNQLRLSALIGMIASGITAYFWLKNIASRNAALFGSIIYMLLPYHLAVNLYWRFALAEYWSFAWMPLILYFTYKIINENKKIHILYLGISYALLTMTHLFTTLIFSPIPLAYVVWHRNKNHQYQPLIKFILGIILGLCLSSIYWITALTYQDYVSLNSIFTGFFDYANNFLFLPEKPRRLDNFYVYLEIITVLTAILAYFAFKVTRSSDSVKFKQESSYWWFVSLTSFLMILPVSVPIWKIFPIIHKIQFPWRFNTVLTLSTSAILALAFTLLEEKPELFPKVKIANLIMIITSIFLGIVQIFASRPNVSPKLNLHIASISVLTLCFTLAIIFIIANLVSKRFNQQKTIIMIFLIMLSFLVNDTIIITARGSNLEQRAVKAIGISLDAKEYRPQWVSKKIFLSPDKVKELGTNPIKAQVIEGTGNLLIEEWKARKISLKVNANTNILISINQFYYPGWTAEISGKTDLLNIQPLPESGLLSINLPPGNYQLIVRLKPLIQERAGQIISGVAAILTLFMFFWWRKFEQKHNINHENSIAP